MRCCIEVNSECVILCYCAIICLVCHDCHDNGRDDDVIAYKV